MAEEKKTKTTGGFDVKKRHPSFNGSGVTYFLSEQEVKSDSGNVSAFFVIKKQGFNEDGSPRGQSKQIFIPNQDIKPLVEHLTKLLR